MRSGVKCGCSTIETPAERTSSRAASSRRVVLGVAEQDQRLLGQIELAGVDENLAGRGEVLRAALALDAAQPRLQRRRARGPDQPVLVVEHSQHPPELPGPAAPPHPARYSVEPNASSATNSCRALAIERPPDLVGAGAFVRLPAVGELRERHHPRDRRLAHLGGPVSTTNRWRREHARARSYARVGQNTRASSCARCDVERGPLPDVRVDQRPPGPAARATEGIAARRLGVAVEDSPSSPRRRAP